jgi:hypothetical protein
LSGITSMDQEAINDLLKELPPIDDGKTLGNMLDDNHVMQLQDGSTSPGGVYPTDNLSLSPEMTPALSQSLPDPQSIPAPLNPTDQGIGSGSQDELQPKEPASCALPAVDASSNLRCTSRMAVPTLQPKEPASCALDASSNLRRTSRTAVPTTLLAQNNAIGKSTSRTKGKENNTGASNRQRKRAGDNVCSSPAK